MALWCRNSVAECCPTKAARGVFLFRAAPKPPVLNGATPAEICWPSIRTQRIGLVSAHQMRPLLPSALFRGTLTSQALLQKRRRTSRSESHPFHQATEILAPRRGRKTCIFWDRNVPPVTSNFKAPLPSSERLKDECTTRSMRLLSKIAHGWLLVRL